MNRNVSESISFADPSIPPRTFAAGGLIGSQSEDKHRAPEPERPIETGPVDPDVDQGDDEEVDDGGTESRQ